MIGGEGGYGCYDSDIERYDIVKDLWLTIKIKSNQKLSPRKNILTFQIKPAVILIAGGYDGESKEDCYIYYASKNELKKVSDLPQSDSFRSPSPIVYKGHVFAVSYGKDTIYKYRIATDKWDKVLNIEEKT